MLRAYTLSPHLVSTLCPFTLRLHTLSPTSPDTEVRCYKNGPAQPGGERGASSSSSSSSSSIPGTAGTAGTTETAGGRGKRLLARVPVDEQTLVPPVAAAMAFGLVPCTRLALHVPHKMPYNNHDYGNPPLPIQKPMRKPLM